MGYFDVSKTSGNSAPTDRIDLAERLERAAEFTEADFDVCSAEDLREAASTIRSLSKALEEAREGLGLAESGLQFFLSIPVPGLSDAAKATNAASMERVRSTLSNIDKTLKGEQP